MGSTRQQIQNLSASGDVLTVLQLTDTHLSREVGGELLGLDTDFSLQAVVSKVRAECPAPDLLLATGDISDHGSRESYQRFLTYTDDLCEQSYWLPGNHDDRAAMEEALGDRPTLSRELRSPHWQILLLDSQIPGEVGGRLGEDELQFLERALGAAQEAGLYSLICLHHQPVAIGCDWLDEQMVVDAGAFFDIIERFPGVRGVLWGHVHQEVDTRRGSARLMATPSTCVQFAPGAETFKADTLSPGYRQLQLHPSGEISSSVERVEGVKFSVDLESGGYL